MSDKGSVNSQDNGMENHARRSFLKGAATASVLSAVGAAAFSQTAAAQESAVEDPQTPPNLKPGGQPDNRFPVTYEHSVPQATKILTQYFAALSRRDIKALAEVFHYPFVAYEGIETVIVDSPEALISNPPPSLNVTGKGANFIKPGAYDIMESMKTEIFGPIGVGLSLDFTRYDGRGAKLYGCGGIYGITNNDGKWGIEYMSTIFNPADLLYEKYNAEAILTAVHENQRFHALARKYNDPVALRKAVTGFLGKYGSVTIGGSNATAIPALEGRPMDPYKVKGVKSRLRISDITQEQLDHLGEVVHKAGGASNMEKFYKVSGGTVGRWYQSLEFAGRHGEGARIIHSSTEKGHVYMGYTRYTADGSVISETRYLGTTMYKAGTWVGSDVTAVFGQTMYRDRSNDDHS
ncbi:MAG TPA: hypothetical protein VGG46_13875 [Terriglobales bacterium]|jgi:hypothetical protein